MVNTDRYRYRAFISYSHLDKAWSNWLHRALESYRISKDLVGVETQAGKVPTTLRPIFRDRDDFSAGYSLADQTRTALQSSQFLLVMCSPNAAKSEYVNEEVRFFKSLGRENRVIAVIVDGIPGDPEKECFPPALRLRVLGNGTVTSVPEEPIAADAREEGDGKGVSLLKIIAALLGVGFDLIVRRDQRERSAQLHRTRVRIAIASACALLLFAAVVAYAYLDQENLVRSFIVKNPEVLQEAMAVLEKRQAVAEAEKARAAIKTHRAILFNSPRQVVLGNPQGDVTFVEFFDYNCGYCKRAMTDMVGLMSKDLKLKVVLKEFPVLGPGSVEAAQVAVAVRMRDKDGKKYLEFHQKLLGGRGQVDKARALAVANEVGLDMTQLEKDMKSDEIGKTLEESMKLAEALGLNGTPSYVIGNDVVIGAVGLPALSEKIKAARRL